MTIEFRNVTLRYHYDQFDVLSGASFTLCDGVNTILCDIQSGKGTICKLILGNLTPTSGQVLLDGQDVAKMPPKNLNALYLSAQPTFFENKSVLFNLEYPCRVRKTLKENSVNLLRLAETFHLTELLQKKVKTLTLQQKITLSVARGLSVPRQIVLFDGFFDDTNLVCNCPELNLDNLLSMFNGIKVILTTRAEILTGNCVVMDGGTCVYQGDSATAVQTASGLGWLADKI